MSSMDSTPRTRPFWRETAFWLVMALVAAVYLPRLADQTIRGEESRKVIVAQEMLARGDFLITREQGELFLDRPPLHNWILAGCMSLWGDRNLWGIRLPSVWAIFVTCGLIYAYGRRFLAPLGAMAAAVAFATMGQVMQLGRLAETDSLFTCFLAASLLVWHALYLAGSPRLLMWGAGYTLAALAALTKGPQAPVYFIGIAGAYLLLVRRDYRTLFSWQHVVGAVMFLIVLGAWQAPFYLAMGAHGSRDMWISGALRHPLGKIDPLDAAIHYSTYPLQILAATLPWSILLIVYLSRWIYRVLDEARPYAAFLATCLAFTLPTCWLAPHAVTRYYVPLFPCLALLVGIVVQRSVESGGVTWWMATWRRYVAGAIVLIAALPLALVAIALFPTNVPASLVQSFGFLVCFTLVAGGAVGILIWSRGVELHDGKQRLAVLTIAGFCGFAYVGLVLNTVVAASTDPAGDIASLKTRLPAHASLVSLGRIHHVFAYYYRDPIQPLPRLLTATAVDPSIEYYCYAQNRQEPEPVSIPFDWEPVATIVCDRARRRDPVDVVEVIRRKTPQTALQRAESIKK